MSLILKSFDIRDILLQVTVWAFVTLIVKIYIQYKPYWDVQRKTKHCDFANFKLIGCDENSTWLKRCEIYFLEL